MFTGEKTVLWALASPALAWAVVLTLTSSNSTIQEPNKQDYPWLRPPALILHQAALRGYQGAEPTPYELYSDGRAACRRSVTAVRLYTPTLLAQRVGFTRKENSGPEPEFDSIRPYGEIANVDVVFGSVSETHKVNFFFFQNGINYEPTETREDAAVPISCGSRTVWLRTLTLVFRGKDSLPSEGAARLIMKLDFGAEYEFPLSFDELD